MKPKFSGQFFEKYSDIIKFHENLSRVSQVVPCLWTGRQTR